MKYNTEEERMQAARRRNRIRHAIYYMLNPDIYKERNRQWRAKHKDYFKDYRNKNKERINNNALFRKKENKVVW